MTHALIGGLLIGASATLFLWFNGRVTGISGIVGRLLTFQTNDSLWRTAFTTGLITAGFIAHRLDFIQINLVTHSQAILAVAGLLVGIGTTMGNGCTSGHGVCGLSRFSKRSLVATIVFMATAALVVYVVRHHFAGVYE
jgi:uncharacterized protein